MILRRVVPGPSAELRLGTPGARDELLQWYTPPRATWLRLNLVTSLNGSAAGSDGTSETLTSPTDRTILGVIRELSDVVLVGAESVRAEGYQVPRHARLGILTTSGDLAGHRLAPERADRVTIVCPQSAADRAASSVPGAEVLVAPDDNGHIAPHDLLATLRSAGLFSIVCEGGPRLASALIESGLVDEVCLTTSPLIGSLSLPAFASPELREHAVRLDQLLIDEASYLFARWSMRESSASH